MRSWRLFGVTMVFLVWLSAPAPSARESPAPLELLDRYAAGQYDAVVAALTEQGDLGHVIDALHEHGQEWIDAEGLADRDRRLLAAATFALEAARVGTRLTWRLTLPSPNGGPDGYTEQLVAAAMARSSQLMPSFGGRPTPGLPLTYFQPPALLLEWGCAELRKNSTPTRVERLWQLAAMGVAERAGDARFLTGEEVSHLIHVRQRFPDEPRFKLATAISAEWATFPGLGSRSPASLRMILEPLEVDQDIGAEALLRLGFAHARSDQDGQAVELFRRAAMASLDPWVIYLAHYFEGAALERRKRPEDAEEAYRAALRAMPRAQSASLALASLLFRHDRRSEASEIVSAFVHDPAPADPWHQYAAADDRFWPVLLAKLRAELRR